jgi:hypothetical protein
MILAIPASSADVERLFSKAGFTCNKYRTNLSSDRFNKMMVVQGNFHPDLYEKSAREKEEEEAARKEKNAKISKGQKEAHNSTKVVKKNKHQRTK